MNHAKTSSERYGSNFVGDEYDVQWFVETASQTSHVEFLGHAKFVGGPHAVHTGANAQFIEMYASASDAKKKWEAVPVNLGKRSKKLFK